MTFLGGKPHESGAVLMEGYYSTLSSWMIPIAKAMQHYGLDMEQALHECGLDLRELQSQEVRVSIRKLSALIDYCNRFLPEQDFTVQIARYFHPGVFHILGYAMMSADTLEEALLQLVAYNSVVCDISNLQLIESPDTLVLDVALVARNEEQSLLMRRQELEAFMAMVVSFARDVVDADLKPAYVTFQFSPPADQGQYLTAFFQCPVCFGQARNLLAFDSGGARQPLLSGNPAIRAGHEKILNEFLARIDRNDLVHQVKCNILERLSLGAPSQTQVAAALGMSVRNLQRKLSELGTSYTQILEHSRQTLALNYMRRQDLSLSEIGYLVGFASDANFHRAFKRWTGQAPGEYRRQLLA
ncbi:AraC family transcriptional regulator [Photobacterium sp. SP02]|uniref:AraC family transcriptional regulator n=1 Tax=Photobacterium sp. SP02 TaxID=3032280 RepID=UPI00314508B8